MKRLAEPAWAWGGLAAAFALLYVPTIWSAAHGIWQATEQSHGPMILAIATWLLYRAWPAMGAELRRPRVPATWPHRALAAMLLVLGLALYVVGRSQSIPFMELGSLPWVLAGCYVWVLGPRALKHVWFPLLFMCFMVPLPGLLVAAVTMPMKIAVSYVAEAMLFALGYPVARAGVMLHVGQYQLMVADACAGLQTLFTLESMGLLYLNLFRHESNLRNVLLALAIVPIAFSANVVRVVLLTLVTYHWGDAAGQGFLHTFAGMVLFVSALLMIILLDGVLRAVFPPAKPRLTEVRA